MIELARRIEAFLSRQPGPLRSSQGGAGIGVGSIKGPREENQDRAAVAYVSLPSGDALLVGLICDGMGGMAQGAEAAGCAAGAFVSSLTVNPERHLRNVIFDAVMAANREVYRRFRGAGGTTLTAITMRSGGEAWVAHVGDSRLYEATSDRVLHLVTRDDTIGGQLKSPDSSADDILDNRLLQFVGIGAAIEPHVFRVQGRPGKTFLLTSDGAHSIGKKALEGTFKTSVGAPEIVRKILYVAEAIGVEDNSSAVSIAVSDFEAARHFSGGTELTIWSPSDKLEMWLGPIEADTGRRSAPEAKQANQPKEKKAPRVKAKQSKKDDTASKPPSDEIDKPQLFIEFGSKGDNTE